MSEVKRFDSLVARISKAVAPIESMEVVDTETKDRAFIALQMIKGYVEEVEAVRTALVKPYNETVKQINGRAKEVVAPLEVVRSRLNRVLVEFDRQARIRQEEERRRIEAERKENDRLAREEMEAAKAVAPDVESLNEEHTRISQETAVKQTGLAEEKKALNAQTVSGVRHNWKFEVVDSRMVKGQFMTPDLIAIGKIVRAMGEGAGSIVGGLRIWDEPTVASGSVAPPRRAGNQAVVRG